MKYLKTILIVIFFGIITYSCSEENPISDTGLTAQFNVNKTTILAGETVRFADTSTGNPTAWRWTFEGGTPATSTEQNPNISYLSSGAFDVSLNVSYPNEDKESILSDYINVQPRNTPPYSGTIFINSNILTAQDPTTYQSIEPKGTGLRTMFDRRVNGWIDVEAHLFEITFESKIIEAQINPEFNATQALSLSSKYGEIIGMIPNALLKDVETIWIHDGINPFGGGNNNLLIHVGQAVEYENDGILEEVFVHEACHTSLDAEHYNSEWISAQRHDPTFISTYAKDNPNREDIAESFLPYLAVRFKSDRIPEEMKNIILSAIPNRIEYLDDQDLDYYPLGN